MAQPYVGEIRIFAGSFAPAGWLMCDGTLLPISENEVLFQLIGTTYGGDGQDTFQLPDLRGRTPIHQGNRDGTTTFIGEAGGVESVALTLQQLPQHRHFASGSSAAGVSASVTAGAWSAWADTPYAVVADPTPDTQLKADSLLPTGQNHPHENMPPYLGLNFIISLFGIFPSQS